MNIQFSPPAIKNVIVNLLHRFHVIIFVITIIGGLTIVVFFLNSTLILSSESDGYTSPSENASFDQTTIDRIKQLRTGGSESQLDLSGRSNPFIE
jgi:hypothetical protein